MSKRTLTEFLAELDGYDRLGFAGRHDDSGIRSKGVNRKPDRRLQDYPYDREVFYGQPTAYDRGSGATGPLHQPLTPKDDEHFSLSILDLEEIMDEVLGSPILLGKSGTGQGGSNIPGVNGWANTPPRPWDRGPMDDELDEAPLTIDTSPPDVEAIPSMQAPDFRFQTDDDLENRLDRIWGHEDNFNLVDPSTFGQADVHMIAPDPWSVINTRLSSRGLYGLMPKESAWDRVTGANRKRPGIS